jgi:uncharacterized protein (TIGR02246 family)
MSRSGRILVNMSKASALSISLFFLAGMAWAGTLSSDDITKIREVHKNYERVWLKGDADGVRALFTEDSVLFPPHADKPRVGRKGLDEFWFAPGGPPTKITKLVVVPKDIGGDGQMAYVWGTDEVAWTTTQNGKTTSTSHKGIFLNVLQKQPDGRWKISHHMWDDPVPQP